MGSALVYVVVVALVAGAVFLLVSVVFGRGEELAPMPPTATPTRLPARDLTGSDVRELRFQQAVRGYKCSEVDWALERLGAEVDALRARVDVLAGSGAGHAGPGPGVDEDAVADPAPTDPTDPTDSARHGRARSRPAAHGVGAARITPREPVDPDRWRNDGSL